MPIEATEPTEITAVYDKWAFTIATTAYPCAKPGEAEPAKVSLILNIGKFRTRAEDNVDELSPLPSDYKATRIDDWYNEVATNPKAAALMAAAMEFVEDYADRKGLL